MDALLKNLASHTDLTIHIIGWLVTALVGMFTMLYRGIWARIKQQDREMTQARTDLDQLIGAHNTMAAICSNGHKLPIIERRENPARQTIANYHEEEGAY